MSGGAYREADEQQLAYVLLALAHDDLADGVRARAGVVRVRLVRRAHTVAVLDDLQHLLLANDLALEQAVHLHLVVLVLEDRELGLVVEQVEQLAAVDLEEAHDELRILPRNAHPAG